MTAGLDYRAIQIGGFATNEKIADRISGTFVTQRYRQLTISLRASFLATRALAGLLLPSDLAEISILT